MTNVYLCSSIANARVNGLVADELRRAGLDVFDPCTIHPHDMEKLCFPEEVFATCRRAIENCDALVIFLDSYGKDSAWEIGFAHGLGKCIVGVVAGSSLFIEDWMVKFTLDRILILGDSWLRGGVDSPDWASIRSRCEMASVEELASRIESALSAR